MARPKRKEGIVERIHIRATEQEKIELETLADKAGLTVSEYLRRAGLHRRIQSRIDEKAIGELARLGGLQKLCLMTVKEQPALESARADLNATLHAILETIRRLDSSDQVA